MSEINRYELEVEGDAAPYMSQHPFGDYVKYDDYVSIMEAKNILIAFQQKELERIRAMLDGRPHGLT